MSAASSPQILIVGGDEDPAERDFAMAEARRLAEGLARSGATLVVLFGSRARGKGRKGSDLDIVAVMPSDERFLDRIARVHAALRPKVPTDLLVYSPDEFERMWRERAFVRDAVEQGMLLHGIRPES